MIHAPRCTRPLQDYRHSDRCIVDDIEFAGELFRRIAPTIPSVFKGAALVGLNERFRFLRYRAGDYFAPHCDGSYQRPHDPSERSFITLMVYLDGKAEGGATRFHDVSNVMCVEFPD